MHEALAPKKKIEWVRDQEKNREKEHRLKQKQYQKSSHFDRTI